MKPVVKIAAGILLATAVATAGLELARQHELGTMQAQSIAIAESDLEAATARTLATEKAAADALAADVAAEEARNLEERRTRSD